MEEKLNREYFDPQAATFNYNVTGGGDSASGGSGGSGMECLQLRSQPGPFHYLISEQAKSLVALQELQNEVGALLEFRDLVIETFPNLRSKMAPSTPASGTRRDWEPGVRVRRKLAAAQDSARAKPQPSVQDSGFSTETSCGKDAHSSASASASATRSRPLEDELWALLDVIQRKGGRLRDEAEILRGELDERTDAAETAHTAEEEFARALSAGGEAGACGACGECSSVARLRSERDALLARAAALGRLDAPLDTPARPPRVPTPDSRKFAAILLESNPVELQRQLLTSTVQNQVLTERMKRVLAQRTLLLERLDRARDANEDLKFRLEEKSIELEGARARVRQLEGARGDERRDVHSSMRDMQPLPLPPARLDDDDERLADTPRRGRPSRIPLHTAHKPAAPRPPSAHSARSAHSAHSARSAASARSRSERKEPRSRPLAPHPQHAAHAPADAKRTEQASAEDSSDWERYPQRSLAAEYVSRVARLAPLVPRAPLPLAAELLLSAIAPAPPAHPAPPAPPGELWHGKPQQYFESINTPDADNADHADDYDSDSLAP